MEREPRLWLTELRCQRGWSQQQLADEADISRNYLSEIESGNKNPSVEVAKRIATTLEFEWTIFFNQVGRETRHATA